MSDHWKTQPREPAGVSEGGQWTIAEGAARKAAGLKETYVTSYHVSSETLRDHINARKFQRVEEDDVKNGIFESYRARLSSGERVQVKPNYSDYFLEDFVEDLSVREEVAYNISEELGLGIVPETVYDPISESSFQVFVEDAQVGLSGSKSLEDIESLSQMQLLDTIIANNDRNNANWLIKDGKIVAIDHGLSMQSSFHAKIQSPETVAAKTLYRSGVLLAGATVNSKSAEAVQSYSAYRQTNKMPLSIKYKSNLVDWLSRGLPGLKGLSEARISEVKNRAEYLQANWSKYFYDPSDKDTGGG